MGGAGESPRRNSSSPLPFRSRLKRPRGNRQQGSRSGVVKGNELAEECHASVGFCGVQYYEQDETDRDDADLVLSRQIIVDVPRTAPGVNFFHRPQIQK